MAYRYILPAVALASSALAQTTNCTGDVTVVTQGDATALSSCSTYDGTITIDPTASGTISLDGIGRITKDLVANNVTGLASLTAENLQEIDGTFNLQGLTTLSNLQFSSLTAVQSIRWITLPNLQQLNFGQNGDQGGVSKVNQVYISDTALTTLSGIELEVVGSMDINNNPTLAMINVNSLTNITDYLSFTANSMNLDVQFPNLESAGNLTFRNVSSISMPSLDNIPGSMGFYSNTFLNFSAPNLTTIGQSLAFQDCPNVTAISMTALATIGGAFVITNNTNLAAIDGFDSLGKIYGGIDFVGSFSAVAFPKLNYVKGGANVLTSSTNSTICNLFKTAHSQNVILGNVNCQNNVVNPSTNGSSTGSGSGSSGSKSAAAANFDPTLPYTGIFGLVAALLFL